MDNYLRPSSAHDEATAPQSSSRSGLPLRNLISRRTNVQFVPHINIANRQGAHSRHASSSSLSGSTKKLSSPPPPTRFRSRVSFDTYENRDATVYSLTLNRCHKDYVYSKRSRTFLCGTDSNDYSDTALEWLIDEMIDDGDEVVCLRVVDKDSKEARDLASTSTSTRDGLEAGYRLEAHRMLDYIQSKNTENRAISLILEFAIGKVEDMIQSMIRLYEPAMLIVGTRGRSLSGFQGLLPGSVSKYCLQYSPVPVIVVRPSSKRDKKKTKRLRDPSRRGYLDILDRSKDGEDGGHVLDPRNRRSFLGVDALGELGQHDATEEARMVAEAIGYRAEDLATAAEQAPLQRVTSGRSATGSARSTRSGSQGSIKSDTASITEDMRSPAMGILMKSPEISDDESEDGTEDSDDETEYLPEPIAIDVKEEAMLRARERALKVQEEEQNERLEAARKENQKPAGGSRSRAGTGDSGYQGAAGALAALEALDVPSRSRKKRSSR